MPADRSQIITTGLGLTVLAAPAAIATWAWPALALPCLLLGSGCLALGYRQRHRQRLAEAEPLNSKGNAWCRVDGELRIVDVRGESAHFLGCEADETRRERPPLSKYIPDEQELEHIHDNPVAIQHGDNPLIAAHVLLCEPRTVDAGDRWLHLRDITEDISRQGELMEAEAELRLVFNTIEECVLLLALDGIITTANAAAREHYGQDIPGRDAHAALRRSEEPGPGEAIQACLANFEPTTLEQHLHKQNRTVAVHVYPIFNSRGNLRQLLYLERDITSQRMMELELQVQHRRLQDSLVRLREVDQARTRWLNSVSHELRTPLTSIRSFSELLLTYPDTDTDTRCEFAGVISRESERLTRLINELLDLAAIESGNLQLQLQDLDFSELARECSETLRALASERRVTIRVDAPDGPLPLHSDRDRLTQVLVNLVSNAIKFSPQGAEVLISCEGDEDEIRFAVEDQGPGIASSDRRQVFRRFTQLSNNLTDKPKGTGLGLTISGEIMQQLGGLLRCTDPRIFTGACFQGRLPVGGPETVATQAAS